MPRGNWLRVARTSSSRGESAAEGVGIKVAEELYDDLNQALRNSYYLSRCLLAYQYCERNEVGDPTDEAEVGALAIAENMILVRNMIIGMSEKR